MPSATSSRTTFKVESTVVYPRLEVDTTISPAVAHAGGVMLTETVTATGLGTHLRAESAPWRKDLAVYDPAKVLLDVALSLALGGAHLPDTCVLRGKPGGYGSVASDSTISRAIDTLASDVNTVLAAIDGARAAALVAAWALAGTDVPDRDSNNNPIIIDLDATLVTAHSDKESAARTWK